MVGISHYGTFLFAGILLNLTPGNDTIYILTHSLARGKQAGVYAALGIGTGITIHTLFAALGLSLLIAESIVLFTFLKYVGAAYLIYLGFKMILEKSKIDLEKHAVESRKNNAATYRDAVLTNVFNPKVALFFIAFLPQFVDLPERHAVLPFLGLGFTFVCTGTLWSLILASLSARFSEHLRSQVRLSSILHKVCGSVLVGLGAKLAFVYAK